MGKNRKKLWSDMSRGRQTATVLASIVQISLLAAALWDIAHRPAAGVNGSKRAWTAASFVNFAGPIAYFLFGRKRPAA
ncbi:MAG: PLD nuclease N-terminal domain-containing protein [Actinomycetota bacterium]